VAFYSTAAQVIPLLFIVVALEFRYFEPWQIPRRVAGRALAALSEGRWRLTGRFIDFLLLLALPVAGEFAALHVLDTGEATGWAHALILVALASLGIVSCWERSGDSRLGRATRAVR
jgi:hypothetical protein